MDFTDENIALFDRYLRQEMIESEKADFEQKLEVDALLKKSFEAFKAFETILEDAEILNFKDKLSSWDTIENEPVKTKGKVFPLRFFSLIAAIIVIALLTITYFFNQSTDQELAAAYFSPYDNVLTVRGTKISLDEGLRLYEEKKFEEALSVFRDYPNDPNALFYKGETELALEKYEEASKTFLLTLESPGIFEEVATFHLALAYLGSENRDQAIEVLSQISETSDYFAEASALLSDLK